MSLIKSQLLNPKFQLFCANLVQTILNIIREAVVNKNVVYYTKKHKGAQRSTKEHKGAQSIANHQNPLST